MKTKQLFLLLILLFGNCNMGPYYWNAEIFNDGKCQLRFVNMLGSQPYYYLRLLTNNNISTNHNVLLMLNGNVKYIFKNDSNLTVDVFKDSKYERFSKTMRGFREDQKDWIFAYYEAILGSSYEKRLKQDTIKNIQYSLTGSIILNSNDTLRFDSQGKLNEGNWQGNWKGK